jgi:hypothetical protein
MKPHAHDGAAITSPRALAMTRSAATVVVPEADLG